LKAKQIKNIWRGSIISVETILMLQAHVIFKKTCNPLNINRL
jgi:hypothetical protein